MTNLPKWEKLTVTERMSSKKRWNKIVEAINQSTSKESEDSEE